MGRAAAAPAFVLWPDAVFYSVANLFALDVSVDVFCDPSKLCFFFSYVCEVSWPLGQESKCLPPRKITHHSQQTLLTCPSLLMTSVSLRNICYSELSRPRRRSRHERFYIPELLKSEGLPKSLADQRWVPSWGTI